MNAADIRKLRYKFILISMISVFLVMAFLGGLINVVSYSFAASSIRSSLHGLIEQNGERDTQVTPFPRWSDIFAPDYNHNHFFITTYAADGGVQDAHGNTTDATEWETARDLMQSVYEGRRAFVRKGIYFLLKEEQDGTVTVACLDCSTEVASIFRILVLTVGVSLAGLLITFLLVWRFSARAVKPEIENNERQKEFITNASHELKTPLAVIRANTELIEMTAGESEWTKSTLNQVERVEGLIKNLVMIARADEQVDRSLVAETDITRAVRETVDTYEAVARQTGKALVRDVAENVCMTADEAKVRQLVTILLDNAIKYCDEGGEVKVSLSAEKKGALLTVSNTYAEGKDLDCDKFFDRFYRQDTSHNIDKGGYGIGLSIADGICRQNKGSIRAAWRDDVISFICTLR